MVASSIGASRTLESTPDPFDAVERRTQGLHVRAFEAELVERHDRFFTDLQESQPGAFEQRSVDVADLMEHRCPSGVDAVREELVQDTSTRLGRTDRRPQHDRDRTDKSIAQYRFAIAREEPRLVVEQIERGDRRRCVLVEQPLDMLVCRRMDRRTNGRGSKSTDESHDDHDDGQDTNRVEEPHTVPSGRREHRCREQEHQPRRSRTASRTGSSTSGSSRRGNRCRSRRR